MQKLIFDNANQAVVQLTEWLGVNETHLAGLLGVTPKSLADWKKRNPGDLPPKAHRLERLYQVVTYLQKHHPEIQAKEYKGLIENGRITIDPDDAEEGSISLLNFINAEPEAKAWAPCVDSVIVDYKNYLAAAGRFRETNRPIRNAL